MKQVPRSVAVFTVLGALFVAFWVLGSIAPKSAAEAQDQKLREGLAKITVPDIQGQTLDGHPFHLSDDTKGKVVLLNFWATWCGPCQKEIPDLIALQKEYGSRGFTVVGLSQDDPNGVEMVKQFVHDKGMSYPTLLAPEGVAQALQIQSLPTTLLIDRNGKIVYAMAGIFEDRPMRDFWTGEIQKVL